METRFDVDFSGWGGAFGAFAPARPATKTGAKVKTG